MKKILFSVAAVATLFLLAACGGKKAAAPEAEEIVVPAHDNVPEYVIVNAPEVDLADFKVDERERRGRFSAREVGLSYEITLSGADLFPSGTEFRDISLLDADEDIEYD